MARPTFVVEGIADGSPVSVTIQSISKECALLTGRDRLTSEHGTVRRVTVRYAASDFRSTAADFIDPNRAEGE